MAEIRENVLNAMAQVSPLLIFRIELRGQFRSAA